MAREKPGKRETKLVAMLQYIYTNMWKALFGRKADGLEKSKDREHTCTTVVGRLPCATLVMRCGVLMRGRRRWRCLHTCSQAVSSVCRHLRAGVWVSPVLVVRGRQT